MLPKTFAKNMAARMPYDSINSPTPGIITLSEIQHMADDLATSGTVVINGVTPLDDDFCTFIDVLEFYADYTTILSSLNVKSYKADVPWRLFTISSKIFEGSRFSNTSMIYSLKMAVFWVQSGLWRLVSTVWFVISNKGLTARGGTDWAETVCNVQGV